MATRRANPILEPLTMNEIMINMYEDWNDDEFKMIKDNNEINISSSLRSIIIIDLRHQNVDVSLIRNKYFKIKKFSTSKVDILINYLEFLKIVILLGLMFVRRYQPIILVLRIIILTFLYSLYYYLYIGRFWYRYILLLIMLRGVLVIFTYIVRIIPNERFEIIRLFYGGILVFFLMAMEGHFFIFKDLYIGVVLWQFRIFWVNLFLILFLLVVIIIVVWITLLERIPVRVV